MLLDAKQNLDLKKNYIVKFIILHNQESRSGVSFGQDGESVIQ
jgi:hypothetical protein